MLKVWLALRLVYASPAAIGAALLLALGMGALAAWSGQFFTYFPGDGWYVDVTPGRLATAVGLSLLFGVLGPMEAYALRKGRGRAAAAGAGAGLVIGLTSISCCTPLLAPALLVFAGFAGTTVASFNAAAYRYATPLSLIAVGLLLVGLAIVSHTITASCALPARGAQR